MSQNKADLVKSVAEKAGLTKEQASNAVDAVTSTIVESLSGEGLALKGFGVFSTQIRPARTGRNPKTKEAIAISEKKIAKFKFSTEVKKVLN